jgi:hypothetical protein
MVNKNPSFKRICPHCGETTTIEIDLKKDPIAVNGEIEKVVPCSGIKKKSCVMSFHFTYSLVVELVSVRKAE